MKNKSGIVRILCECGNDYLVAMDAMSSTCDKCGKENIPKPGTELIDEFIEEGQGELF